MSEPYDAEDVFLPQSDRLQILSREEYELLWGLPRFTQDERDLFFALNPREERVLKGLRTPRTKTLGIDFLSNGLLLNKCYSQRSCNGKSNVCMKRR